MGVRGRLQGVIDGDHAPPNQPQEGGLERLHPVELALLDDLVDLRGQGGVDDPVHDPPVVDEDLDDRHPTSSHLLHQSLADHASEDACQRHPNLVLLEWREEVDDAVHRLNGVGRVECGQHQMPRLGCGQRSGHRFRVPHLPDQDDVRILAHGRPHGAHVAIGVQPDLPLVQASPAVGMQHLDGVFDGQDVDGLAVVDVVDHAGQRGRLPAPGRTRHQDQASRRGRQLANYRGEPEILERGTPDPNPSHDDADRPALPEHVHPETAEAGDRVGEVDFLLEREEIPPVRRDDGLGDQPCVVGHDRAAGQPSQLPVHPNDGGLSDDQVQVRTRALCEGAQQSV